MSKWTIRIFSCAFCSVLFVVRVQEFYVYYIYFIIGMWIKNPIKLYDLRLWSVHILPEQRYKQIILDQYIPYSQSHIPPYTYIYIYICIYVAHRWILHARIDNIHCWIPIYLYVYKYKNTLHTMGFLRFVRFFFWMNFKLLYFFDIQIFFLIPVSVVVCAFFSGFLQGADAKETNYFKLWVTYLNLLDRMELLNIAVDVKPIFL